MTRTRAASPGFVEELAWRDGALRLQYSHPPLSRILALRHHVRRTVRRTRRKGGK